MRADHAFYLAVGWASALLLVVEVLALWRRARRARHLAVERADFDHEEAP
ncbi:hypothetical protein [Mitsuaria sp. GD03876]|nr:hypothetical protein [Mitsuaria sp. GD03876]MDH0868415.1 hypothetical protein [Mitsuaria sp. GD03876]